MDLSECPLADVKRVSNGGRDRLSLRGHEGRVLEEEAQHLSRGVWALRIGVGANGAASRPSMSGSMDVPVLKDCPPARVGMDSARI